MLEVVEAEEIIGATISGSEGISEEFLAVEEDSLGFPLHLLVFVNPDVEVNGSSFTEEKVDGVQKSIFKVSSLAFKLFGDDTPSSLVAKVHGLQEFLEGGTVLMGHSSVED